MNNHLSEILIATWELNCAILAIKRHNWQHFPHTERPRLWLSHLFLSWIGSLSQKRTTWEETSSILHNDSYLLRKVLFFHHATFIGVFIAYKTTKFIRIKNVEIVQYFRSTNSKNIGLISLSSSMFGFGFSFCWWWISKIPSTGKQNKKQMIYPVPCSLWSVQALSSL